MIPGHDKHPPLKDSFRYAFNGIRDAFSGERNIKIMLANFLGMVVVGFWLHFDMIAWTVLVLTSGCTLAAELLNTAIEEIVDFVCPYMDERAGRAKDIASGAVLILSIASVVIGALLIIRCFI